MNPDTATGATPANSIAGSFQAWFEEQKKTNKIVSSACRKTINIPQSCVGLILGKQGRTVIALRQRTNCWISINQDKSRETGFSECTITAETDDRIQKCEAEIAQLIDDFQNGRNTRGMRKSLEDLQNESLNP